MKIFELIGWQYVLIYFLVINIIAFLMYFADKKFAKNGDRRIPEKSLLGVVLLGGWIGSLLGMYICRHKTKKMRFTIGVPLIIISEIAILIYLCYNNYIKL